MTAQEIKLTKEFAQNQIVLLNSLIKALDTAENLIEQNQHKEQLINQYSYELSVSQSRISEDSSTIAIKDGQLNNAAIEIEQLKNQIHNMTHSDERDHHAENISIPPVDESFDIGSEHEEV